MKNILYSLIICLSLISCNKEKPDEEYKGSCPTCSDIASWNGTRRYGEWELQSVGYDGYFNILINGSTHLERDCGWEINGNEVGGIGKTYAVFSCDSGVILRWRYGKFDEIILLDGWFGKTPEGIKIGDNIKKFLEVYPKFHVHPYYYDSTLYQLFDSTVCNYAPVAKAWFTEKNFDNGQLKKIAITSFGY